MATQTTNMQLYKPAVNDPVDADLWGGQLNTNADTIEAWETRQQMTLYIPSPEAKDYRILANSRFPFAIKQITTRAEAGTASLTGKINSTALGGTANSVSTTEQTQTHASANSVAVGDDFLLAFSSLSGCTGVTVTIWYDRTGAGTS